MAATPGCPDCARNGYQCLSCYQLEQYFRREDAESKGLRWDPVLKKAVPK